MQNLGSRKDLLTLAENKQWMGGFGTKEGINGEKLERNSYGVEAVNLVYYYYYQRNKTLANRN